MIANDGDGEFQAGSHWPDRLGKISMQETFEDSPLLVWKIEDANYARSSQVGALNVLDHLTANRGIELICLEGAAGQFATSELKAAMRAGDAGRLRDDFAQSHIGAAEYLAMTSDRPLELWGVEDGDSYQRNAEALRHLYRHANAIEHAFEVLERHIQHLKAAIYDADQLEFDRICTAHQDGEVQLSEFIETLVRHDDQLLSMFPNMRRFVACLAAQRALDFGRAKSDRGRLLDHLMRCLNAPHVESATLERTVRAAFKATGRDVADVVGMPRAARVREYKQFVKSALAQLVEIGKRIQQEMLPDEHLYEKLLDLAGVCAIDLRRYSELMRYIHYVHQAHSIRASEFLQEVQDATEMVSGRVLGGSEEHLQVAAAARAVHGLHKRCLVQATPKDEERLLLEFGPLTATDLCRRVAVGGRAIEGMDGVDLPAVDEAMVAARSFYHLAPFRGRALAKNTLQQMRLRGAREVVLVSGGFLTEFILPVFQHAHVSYAVVMPRIEPTPQTFTEYARAFVDDTARSGSYSAELRRRMRGNNP